MIEGVERIGPELQIQLVGEQRKVLGQTQVLVEVSGATKIIAAPNCEANRSRKRGQGLRLVVKDVDRSARGLMSMTSDQSAVPVEDSRSIVRIARHVGVRHRAICNATVPIRDAADVPSAYRLIQPERHRSAKRPAPAKR